MGNCLRSKRKISKKTLNAKEVKVNKVSEIKIEIQREERNNFTTYEKHLWRMILSKTDYLDLKDIALVCKGFFFMLKKDEIFWMLFARNQKDKLSLQNLPERRDKESTWKRLIIDSLQLRWNLIPDIESIYRLNDKRSLESIESSGNWIACLSDNPLYENVMYTFEVLDIETVHLVLGVATKETDPLSTSLYGVKLNSHFFKINLIEK
eukprot:TRINITY_DN6449_c0_g1_i1.p1 TRINITY_DN6449_c0_g1~~TRINITY_DN6449_c0_g1_i1.p1  ORF type:complete len:208 (-),score=29.13 TRINITY_DN6449_c0_g1_i1:373-996(-)